MAQSKRILVACGTAIATSTVVAKALEEGLADRGIQVTTRQCKVTELPGLARDYDLIVATTPVSQDVGVPVVPGLPFLTGVGKAETLDQIIKLLSHTA